MKLAAPAYSLGDSPDICQVPGQPDLFDGDVLSVVGSSVSGRGFLRREVGSGLDPGWIHGGSRESWLMKLMPKTSHDWERFYMFIPPIEP